MEDSGGRGCRSREKKLIRPSFRERGNTHHSDKSLKTVSERSFEPLQPIEAERPNEGQQNRDHDHGQPVL